MASFYLALSLSLLVLLSIQPWQALAKDNNVFVVGHVYCDQCLDHNLTNNAIFLQGASITIKCKDLERHTWETVIATTNEKGYFQSKLHGDFNPTCYAHIKSSPSTLCNVKGLNMKKSSDFEVLYSIDNNVTYSLGEFTFSPSILPSLCQQSTIHGNVSPNTPKSLLHGATSSTPPLNGNKTLKPPKPPLHGTKPPKPPLHGPKPPKPPLHGAKPPKPLLHGPKPPKPHKLPQNCQNPSKSPKTPLHGSRHRKKRLHKTKTPKPPSDGVKPPKSSNSPIKKPPLHGSKPHKHHKHHAHKHHKAHC